MLFYDYQYTFCEIVQCFVIHQPFLFLHMQNEPHDLFAQSIEYIPIIMK